MEIKEAANKEMQRVSEIINHVKIIENDKNSTHFLEFASNYYKDGCYFFKDNKFIEAFEAFIIAWAYIDCGLKLGFFSIPPEQKHWFTA